MKKRTKTKYGNILTLISNIKDFFLQIIVINGGIFMSIIYSIVKGLSKLTTSSKKVCPHIHMLDFTIVNAFLINHINGNINEWVLVDTGLENSANFIIHTAEKYFGENTKPTAIILTHGHFDHVGSIKQLIEKWQVPIYAHKDEFPYLTGNKDYPKPDPTVDGGLVSEMSPSFPHSSIDISSSLIALPDNGSIPVLPNWKYIHTPGHTEGHISLFDEVNHTLIAGDAFTTLKQESFLSVLTKKEEISGPPSYLTTNWQQAYQSIVKLQDLMPKVALLSHGKPMEGKELSRHLHYLVTHFEEVAIPEEGKYL